MGRALKASTRKYYKTEILNFLNFEINENRKFSTLEIFLYLKTQSRSRKVWLNVGRVSSFLKELNKNEQIIYEKINKRKRIDAYGYWRLKTWKDKISKDNELY